MKRSVFAWSIAVVTMLVASAHGAELRADRATPLVSQPLLLPPQRGPSETVMRRALERHPELTTGSEQVTHAVLAVAFGADGSIFESTVRHAATTLDLPRHEGELYRWLPIADGDGLHRESYTEGTSIAESAPLISNLTLMSTMLPADFDSGRSARRVRAIAEQQRPQLFLSTASRTLNRLMVLLREDGTILLEDVEAMRPEDLKPGLLDDDHEQRFAAVIASVLKIDPSRIGIEGATMAILSDQQRALFIVYGWERRPSEDSPRIYGRAPVTSGFDRTLASELVARHVPDAFSSGPTVEGTPALLLSTLGEVVRAGRLPTQSGGLTAQALQHELLRDMRISEIRMERLGNGSGPARDVLFVWGTAGIPSTTAGQ